MFVTFSKSDFDEFINKHYPNSSLFLSSPDTNEYIYLIPTTIPHIIVKVFSSIDTRTNTSREYGSDALRAILFNTKINRPISHPRKSHIKRMKNWRLYLKSTITELKNKVEFYNRICPKCGNPLIHRIKKTTGVSFFGCSSYPQCIYTEPFEKTTTLQIPSPSVPKQKISPSPKFIPNPQLIKTISIIYNISPSYIENIKDKDQFSLLIGYAAPHNWSKYGITSESEAKTRIIYILNKFAGTNLALDTLKVNWIGELKPIPISSPKVKEEEEITLELSDIEHGAKCPKCSGYIKIGKEYKDAEGDVTHFDAFCRKCNTKITVLND